MKDKKARKWWALGMLAFLAVGIASFIVGYGLKDGWDAVLAWFTSKWATYVYIGIVVYLSGVLALWQAFRVEKVTGGRK